MHLLRARTGWNAVLTTVYSRAFSRISSANSQADRRASRSSFDRHMTVVFCLYRDVRQRDFGTLFKAPINSPRFTYTLIRSKPQSTQCVQQSYVASRRALYSLLF